MAQTHSRFAERAMASSLMLASMALAACSVGSRGNDPTSGPSARHGATVEPSPGLSDSDVVTLSVPPSSVCTISPEHADKDEAHRELVPVGAEGQLRFYVPSDDWGSRLQVDCTAGDVRTQRVVDLNDESTFTRKPEAEFAARPLGAQPALTGDPAALPVNELLKRGYPPRPDPARAPERYAKWLRRAALPMNVFSATPVARLGGHGGPYAGGGHSDRWDGFVQAGGFSPDLLSQGNVNYTVYAADMFVPPGAACLPNSQSCDSLIWAGIGGYPTMFYGGSITGELIQSGIDINGARRLQYLFIEYTPGAVWDVPLPANDTLSPGDEIQLWGWSAADMACQTPDSIGEHGCFSFGNVTKGWTLSPMSLPLTGRYFIPSSVEYVAERPTETMTNAKYGNAEIAEGAAYDSSFNYRGDPAIGADPYVWATTGTPSKPSTGFSLAKFANGTQSTPADPMYFIWEHY
jgi:hypothetical protein